MYIEDKVVYQIYPKSFKDSNNNGWGDIQGIISKLDYLKTLNIDFIWLNPVSISPQRDNGYDVADYCSIDPRYGTMKDFIELCQEARKRDINIMCDMVFNHSSINHKWFQEAINGNEKYKKYYIFKKGKDKNTPPNNWQSKFGGSAWCYVESLDEWYLHLYDETQADFDWTNPEVRDEFVKILEFWYKVGVRGFRFDVVNNISKGSFEDDPNHRDGKQFYADGPHVHEYLRELNERSFGTHDDVMTVGEMSATSIENCVKYAGKDAHELDAVFTFHHLKVDYKDGQKWVLQPYDFHALKDLLNSWQTGMQEHNAMNALFFNNHDQPRAISRFLNDREYRKESGKLLGMITHMMRGIPYIYMGEEIGMTNAYFTDINQYVDVESLNMYDILLEEGHSKEEVLHILQERSRDNSRTPMQWDDSKNAGFSDVTPWLEVNKNYHTINVEVSLKDKDSIFYTYQKLIQLRKDYKVIQTGIYQPELIDHDQIFAYKRRNESEELYVISNFFDKEVEMNIDDSYELLLSNYKDRSQTSLRPYECLILYKQVQ